MDLFPPLNSRMDNLHSTLEEVQKTHQELLTTHCTTHTSRLEQVGQVLFFVVLVACKILRMVLVACKTLHNAHRRYTSAGIYLSTMHGSFPTKRLGTIRGVTIADLSRVMLRHLVQKGNSGAKIWHKEMSLTGNVEIAEL